VNTVVNTVACTIGGDPAREPLIDGLIRARADRHPFTGPVEVTLTVRLPAPGRATKWWQHLTDRHASRPEADRLSGVVIDALVASAVIVGRAQVSDLYVTKRYATAAAPPAIQVFVRSVLKEPRDGL
jgi:Holliday junction resolvase RusA-like endonuclease